MAEWRTTSEVAVYLGQRLGVPGELIQTPWSDARAEYNGPGMHVWKPVRLVGSLVRPETRLE
jgi:hypothetical protein